MILMFQTVPVLCRANARVDGYPVSPGDPNRTVRQTDWRRKQRSDVNDPSTAVKVERDVIQGTRWTRIASTRKGQSAGYTLVDE
jgi:hypothetical protein